MRNRQSLNTYYRDKATSEIGGWKEKRKVNKRGNRRGKKTQGKLSRSSFPSFCHYYLFPMDPFPADWARAVLYFPQVLGGGGKQVRRCVAG